MNMEESPSPRKRTRLSCSTTTSTWEGMIMEEIKWHLDAAWLARQELARFSSLANKHNSCSTTRRKETPQPPIAPIAPIALVKDDEADKKDPSKHDKIKRPATTNADAKGTMQSSKKISQNAPVAAAVAAAGTNDTTSTAKHSMPPPPPKLAKTTDLEALLKNDTSAVPTEDQPDKKKGEQDSMTPMIMTGHSVYSGVRKLNLKDLYPKNNTVCEIAEVAPHVLALMGLIGEVKRKRNEEETDTHKRTRTPQEEARRLIDRILSLIDGPIQNREHSTAKSWREEIQLCDTAITLYQKTFPSLTLAGDDLQDWISDKLLFLGRAQKRLYIELSALVKHAVHEWKFLRSNLHEQARKNGYSERVAADYFLMVEVELQDKDVLGAVFARGEEDDSKNTYMDYVMLLPDGERRMISRYPRMPPADVILRKLMLARGKTIFDHDIYEFIDDKE
mmetsp:Transcript_15653/g.43171  ORF Transcript_15653/g.43171 Transcript_15653/m.43171 type:complete len:448 (-) Transcript_15653:84-1427(-)